MPEDLNHEVKYMFYFMLIATYDMLFEAVSFSRSKSFPLVWLYQILWVINTLEEMLLGGSH